MNRHCSVFLLFVLLSVSIFIGNMIDGASAKSIVETDMFPLKKIPAAARKAGGSIKTNSPVPTNTAMEERIIADHRSDLSTPLSSPTEISSSSNKVNSNLNQDSVDKSLNNLRVSENDNNVKSGNSNINREVDIYNEESYSEEDEEQDCPRGKFWHIRGLRCVPKVCPMGNSLRNKHTGECLHIDYNSNSGSIKDKGHICRYCIEKHIMPYGACCHKVMSQPHLAGGSNTRFQIVSRNTYKKYPRKHITRG